MEAISRENCPETHFVRNLLCAFCFFILLGSPVQAASNSRLAFCNSCYSDYSFRSAAEQSSFDYSPGMEGVDRVYVLNPMTEEIQYFNVNRWYGVGGLEPRSTPKKGGQILGTKYGYFHAEAIPAAGDPIVEAAILEGLDAAKSFAQGMLGSVDIGDIDPGSNIDSAIDLIGPDNSQAGFNRDGLKSALNDYYNTAWAQEVFALSDLGKRFVDKILSKSQLLDGGAITVVFEDGTVIQVKLKSVAEGMDGGPLYMELDVIQESARGPGLWSVPVSEGQFGNFSYTGSSGTVRELVSLALRYGIPVTGPGGGDGDEDTMECEIEGDAIRCRVSYSPH